MIKSTFQNKTFAILASAAVLSITAAGSTLAAEPGKWSHATALSGTPKYGDGFTKFDYVNPDAPRGGLVRLSTTGSFDTLNPVLQKGDSAPGSRLVLETLMTSSLDEINISAEYGLLAEAIMIPADFAFVKFRLRAEAKWHDGQPVTPEDVGATR